MIKISCCLIGITLHVNENELSLIQRLTAVWWKLPAVRLQLPVWLFTGNVLIKTPGGSAEISEYLWFPFGHERTVKHPLSACSKLLFQQDTILTQTGSFFLYCGGKCPIASSTLCKCLCSSDAVHAQSCFQSCVRPHWRYTLLFWPEDSEIANKAIFMF